MRNTLVALALAAVLPAAARAAAGPQVPSDLLPSRVEAAPPDALERQRQLVSAMPEVKIAYDDWGGVRRLTGDTGLFLGDPSAAPMVADHGALALDVLGPMLLAAGSERLTVQTVRDAGAGERVVVFEESIRGIPVLAALAVWIDAGGHVTGLGSTFLPDRGLPQKPAIDANEARRLLEEALVGSTYAEPGSVSIAGVPMLAYAKSQEDGRPALVWLVDAAYTSPWEGPREKRFWVHAVTGRVEGKSELSRGVFDTAWTANNTLPNRFGLPAGTTPVFVPGDTHAQAAITSLAITEAVFSDLGIPSIGPIRILLNYGNLVPNAFYNFVGGYHWIVLGNGGTIPMPEIRDAVAHEWGHGFYKLQLGGATGSTFESASIEEGYADLAAVVVDARNGVRHASWQIAEGAVGLTLGLRSWTDPRSVGFPARDWYPLRALSGDAHKNATILGHAFYLLSQGGRHAWAGVPPVPVVDVPGLGFARARDIFLGAMLRPELFNPDSFHDVRDATWHYASYLDSLAPGEGNAPSVAAAWTAVGLGDSCSAPPGVPDLDLGNFFCRGRYNLTWPPVPGATTYHGEIVPPGWPWSLSQPIIDGPVNSCRQNVPRTMHVHIRACNGCGCSPFSPTDVMYFYSPCL